MRFFLKRIRNEEEEIGKALEMVSIAPEKKKVQFPMDMYMCGCRNEKEKSRKERREN